MMMTEEEDGDIKHHRKKIVQVLGCADDIAVVTHSKREL